MTCFHCEDRRFLFAFKTNEAPHLPYAFRCTCNGLWNPQIPQWSPRYFKDFVLDGTKAAEALTKKKEEKIDELTTQKNEPQISEIPKQKQPEEPPPLDEYDGPPLDENEYQFFLD